jgi:hypothetical protein
MKLEFQNKICWSYPSPARLSVLLVLLLLLAKENSDLSLLSDDNLFKVIEKYLKLLPIL